MVVIEFMFGAGFLKNSEFGYPESNEFIMIISSNTHERMAQKTHAGPKQMQQSKAHG